MGVVVKKPIPPIWGSGGLVLHPQVPQGMLDQALLLIKPLGGEHVAIKLRYDVRHIFLRLGDLLRSQMSCPPLWIKSFMV